MAQKKRNGGHLMPQDVEELEKLASAIQLLEQGPFIPSHTGYPNLKPDQVAKLEDILAKQEA